MKRNHFGEVVIGLGALIVSGGTSSVSGRIIRANPSAFSLRPLEAALILQRAS